MKNILKRDFFVNVCGVPFKYIEQVSTDRVDGFMGRSDSKMGLITINADMPKVQKEATLIHEWIHATLDLQGMGDLSNNEQLVSVLANELYRQGFRIKCVDDSGDCCLYEAEVINGRPTGKAILVDEETYAGEVEVDIIENEVAIGTTKIDRYVSKEKQKKVYLKNKK